MKQVLLLAGTSALVGGVAGAGVALWLATGDTERGAPAPALGTADQAQISERAPVDSTLLERVEGVERAVRALQIRREAVPTSPPEMGQADEASARQTAPPVGDPVFEAAVLDILERAEDDRDSERDVKRTERARQRAEHWASELTTRLALSPAQTARVLEIQTELVSALRQRGRNAPDGQFVPRQQRRAQSEALREQAEQQLRDVLDPQQVARYDQLDEELKIVRSTNAD